ncbi:MAG TPA: type I DNA topoisomerase [Acidimicrobiales bacterium]|nr:type I DNA topoisomerase [Acidimicrobiales bacterium]
MPTALVIVESPAKAKTIAGYLGSDYVVESSIGHVRDLPRNAADVPAAYKNESWARLGIDVDNDFKPLYVISSDRKDQIKKLRSLVKDVDEIYLATDEDREGEAIAWHLLEVLHPRVPVKRMVFHEITKKAILEAIDNPRELDRRLVDAQEARRMLDRLYGYEVSPVLWKKVMPRLSAGRVQSVATRVVVERERERMRFVSARYWDLSATFHKIGDLDEGEPRSFGATLTGLDGKRIATGRDFDSQGKTKSGDVIVLDEPESSALLDDLADTNFSVNSVESKPYRRRPAAPFMTSTFQQEASRKLRLSSREAMRYAQSLYEKGYITYMRTDSTTLSDSAVAAARSIISERYGRDFLPDGPRHYASKVKNAQEAHEAIRPAGESFKLPEQVASEVATTEARVYELIWQRTVASQMTDAVGETVVVRVGGDTRTGRATEFSATGTIITHAGFRRAYVEDVDDDADRDSDERRLPNVVSGEALDVADLEPAGHETSPPPRFTEASLVKKLEELGVGRPSTYASIMTTIQERGYVWKKGSALVPTLTAFSVVSLLEEHFPNLVDYAFTARMEDDLDEIANGIQEAVPWLSRFYFGLTDVPGLKEMVNDRLGEIDARAINTIPLGVTADGEPVVARVGKNGPYLQCGEKSRSIRDDMAPDELTLEKAIELLDTPDDRPVGLDPETGLEVLARNGRFGPYVQLGHADPSSKTKPKSASLLSSMSLETITLDEALKVLSLPRVLGADPADNEEITVQNGRYGPYVKKGNDSRSLAGEDQLFTITLDEALAVLAEPKRRRGQGEAKGPLREIGADPDTGKPIVAKDGRFGVYVTDGETNASLRKGDMVETLTLERACELLAERRAAAPRPAKRGRGLVKKAAARPAAKRSKAAAKTAPRKAAKATAAKKPAKK